MAKAPKFAEPETELEEGEAPPPKKSRKKLFFFIMVIVLLGGGAAAFMLLNPAAAPRHGGSGGAASERAIRSDAPPIFVDLGQFTANLMRENEDRYLQVSIAFKITDAGLEEKIKLNRPEILHRVNMVLQSKTPSDLSTYEGKEKLAQQIRDQVEYVLGFRKTAPNFGSDAPIIISASKSGITDVLFTSFIIQ